MTLEGGLGLKRRVGMLSWIGYGMPYIRLADTS